MNAYEFTKTIKGENVLTQQLKVTKLPLVDVWTIFLESLVKCDRLVELRLRTQTRSLPTDSAY